MDIRILLHASDQDEEWLLTVADDIMDYLMGVGHEVVVTTNTVRKEIGIDLSPVVVGVLPTADEVFGILAD